MELTWSLPLCQIGANEFPPLDEPSLTDGSSVTDESLSDQFSSTDEADLHDPTLLQTNQEKVISHMSKSRQGRQEQEQQQQQVQEQDVGLVSIIFELLQIPLSLHVEPGVASSRVFDCSTACPKASAKQPFTELKKRPSATAKNQLGFGGAMACLAVDEQSHRPLVSCRSYSRLNNSTSPYLTYPNLHSLLDFFPF